jgi:tetratricopeptide (TPR) repeat protein
MANKFPFFELFGRSVEVLALTVFTGMHRFDGKMRLKRGTLSAFLAILIFSGCSRSPQAQEAGYLEKGKKEFQRKNYATAVIHFKNAMQALPRDAEPYYQLGLTYLAGGDINTAASYLRKATELNPKHTGAQLKLAELMSTGGSKEMVEDAQRRTREVLTLQPQDADALNVLAFTELRLGNPESAVLHLEEALRNSPSNLRSSVTLAQARMARKDPAGAEEALQQAVAQAPKSPEPRDYLGGFYFALGRTDEAEQQFRRALEIDPKHGPALLALAAMQVRAGKSAEAEQTYRLVSALPQKQYKPAHALFLLQSGKPDQAVAELEKLAKDDPADRGLRTELVRAYLSLNRIGDAEKVLTAALKKNGMDADARLQRSRIYLASGKLTEAQADLNHVLHFRNDSAEAHYLLSKVRQGRGEIALQEEELGQALRLDPELLAVRIELAQVQTANRSPQAALQLLDEAPAEQRRTLAVVLQRNWALVAMERVADARKGVDQALSAGKVPEALLQDAVLKLGQKDYAGARASAEGMLTQKPEDVRALQVLVQSYWAQNQLPTGLQKAREHASRHETSGAVQHFLGRLLSATGDRVGARKAFEAAKAAQPDMVAADQALAEIDTAEGKRDQARKRLAGMLASHPDYLPGRLLLAQLDIADGKTEAAIEQYRKAVASDEENPSALNGLAYLLAENKQPDEALKYAQHAKELSPNDPATADTLGWTYFQKGLYSMAVAQLEEATAKDGTAVRKYHLAQAYLKAGDSKRGRQTLDAALKMDSTIPEAQAARQVFGLVAN